MKVYVVEALRYGDREKHSLVVGVYDNARAAARDAVAYEYWRGGKYICEIAEIELMSLFRKQEFLDNSIDAEQQKREVAAKLAAIKR